MRIENFILKVLIWFNITTLILYIFSPFTINSGFKSLNVIYIFVNIYMINLGFKSGVRRAGRVSSYSLPSNISKRTFYYILIFYICTFLLRYSYLLFTPPLDISALINRIIVGVLDPQAGRLFAHGATRTLPWFVFFLMTVVDSVFFIIAFLKWKEYSKWIQAVIVLLVIFDLFFWRATGTNFGTFMLLTSLLFAVFISFKSDILNRKAVMKYLLLGLIGCFVMLLVFGSNMEGRAGGDLARVDNSTLFEGSQVEIDENHFIYEGQSDRQDSFLTLVFSYLTQGYMFLEYIYKLDFHWGGLFGNNPAAQSFANDFLDFNPEIDSYQLQIEQFGVDHDTYWHSCYLWLANDFTLFGVPIVIYFISKLCAFALVVYRRSKDLSSGIIFIIFATMLMFLFANNNYISTVFYSFIFIFPYWFFTKYIL